MSYNISGVTVYGVSTWSTIIFSVVCLAIASICRFRFLTPASRVYFSISTVIVSGVMVSWSLVSPWSSSTSSMRCSSAMCSFSTLV